MPLNVFNTEQDEMALSHILTKPIFLTAFKMTGNDSYNTKLWAWNVGPDYAMTTTRTGPPARKYNSNTYLSYLCQMFRFWRGGLRYQFKVIKTPFHSGRVRVDLVPGATDTTGVSGYDKAKCYSKIFDLREGNEFTIDVPFVWNNPWKKVQPVDSTGGNPIAALYVTVLNSLRNPTTCASEIEFLVEQSAQDDFQFAFPALNGAQYEVSDVGALNTNNPRVPNAQSGSTIIPMKTSKDFDANNIGVGEAVLSLRQVLKRYQQMPAADVATPVVSPYRMVHEYVNIRPTDTFSWVMCLYRFMSGSMRVAATVRDPGQGETASPITKVVISNPQLYLPSPAQEAGYKGPLNFQIRSLEPFVEYQVPFYQLWPAIPTGVGKPNNSTNDLPVATNYDSIPSNRGTDIAFQNLNGSPAPVDVYRAIGEDFAAGFLIGPPVTSYIAN